LEICPDTRLVGYVGGLIDRKRPVAFVDIIKAFCDCTPQVPLAGLLFANQFGKRSDLERPCVGAPQNSVFAARIHLMGFRSDISACMAGLDALLVPAVNEPFGRTLIEAMLLGTPVIATRHGVTPRRSKMVGTVSWLPRKALRLSCSAATDLDETGRIGNALARPRAASNAKLWAFGACGGDHGAYARLMTSRKAAS